METVPDVNVRKKFSPGPGFEPRSLAQHASKRDIFSQINKIGPTDSLSENKNFINVPEIY